MQAKEAALPEEPSASDAAPVVTCVLRFPDGSRTSRRFRTSDLLQGLFDFTDAKVGRILKIVIALSLPVQPHAWNPGV